MDNSERQAIAVEFIEQSERRHQETGNPVFVWEAIHECSRTGLPFPGFVKAYLGRASEQIALLSRSAVPREKQIVPKLAEALEFRKSGKLTGATNPFTRIGDDSHELVIAFEIHTQFQEGHTKEISAFTRVSETHPARCDHDPRCAEISASTLRTIWKKHGHRFDRSQKPGAMILDLLRPFRKA